MLSNIIFLSIFHAFIGNNALMTSSVGRDFVFAFFRNLNGDNCQLWALVSNANSQAANVTVTSIYSTFQTINILIAPNSIEKVEEVRARLIKAATRAKPGNSFVCLINIQNQKQILMKLSARNS
jgi:hypothetical protein